MFSNQLKRALNYKAVQIVLLILALAYTFSFCLWSRGCEDPYYWLNVFRNSTVASSLSGGTIAIGHFWCEHFGYTLLSIRILGWLFCVLALCMPYLFVYKPEEWLDSDKLMPLSLTLVLMGYGTFNEFSPGTASFLFLSLTALCLFLYWRSGKVGILVPVGLFAALALWCRLPNVVAILIVVLSILVYAFIQKRGIVMGAIHFSVLVAAFLLFYSGLYYLSHGNLAIIPGSVDALTSADSGRHSVSLLIDGMIDDTNVLLLYSCFVFLVWYLCTQYDSASTVFGKLFCFAILAILVIFFLKENIGIHKWFNRNLHMFMSAVSISMLIVLNYRAYKQGFLQKVVGVDFCFMVLMVLPLGSDTLLLKLFPALLVPMPFLIKSLAIRFDKLVNIFILASFLTVTLLAYGENNISKGYRGNVIQMKELSSIPVLKGIMINEENCKYIDQLIDNYTQLCNGDNVVFYGDASHFAYAVTGASRHVVHPFFSDPDDSLHIRAVSTFLEENDAVVFDFEQHDWDFLHKELNRLDYQLIGTGEYYCIYGPSK